MKKEIFILAFLAACAVPANVFASSEEAALPSNYDSYKEAIDSLHHHETSETNERIERHGGNHPQRTFRT